MGALIAAHLDGLVVGLRALGTVGGIVGAAMLPPILAARVSTRRERDR